jgi:hypothetical protein
MIDIYWSPYSSPVAYTEDFLIYDEPKSLYKEILPTKNKDNYWDNFLNCPAFIKSINNTFVIKNHINANLGIDRHKREFVPLDQQSVSAVEFFKFKEDSRTNFNTVNFHMHYIFFSESSVNIRTLPAFLHKTDFQTKCNYVPGSFDISKWFRPIEGATELRHDVDILNARDGDPLYYIEFDSDEPIRFKKFYMTPEIWLISQSCIKYKKFKSNQPLKSLYNIFQESRIRSKLMKEIKNNLI